MKNLLTTGVIKEGPFRSIKKLAQIIHDLFRYNFIQSDILPEGGGAGYKNLFNTSKADQMDSFNLTLSSCSSLSTSSGYLILPIFKQ